METLSRVPPTQPHPPLAPRASGGGEASLKASLGSEAELLGVKPDGKEVLTLLPRSLAGFISAVLPSGKEEDKPERSMASRKVLSQGM